MDINIINYIGSLSTKTRIISKEYSTGFGSYNDVNYIFPNGIIINCLYKGNKMKSIVSISSINDIEMNRDELIRSPTLPIINDYLSEMRCTNTNDILLYLLYEISNEKYSLYYKNKILNISNNNDEINIKEIENNNSNEISINTISIIKLKDILLDLLRYLK